MLNGSPWSKYETSLELCLVYSPEHKISQKKLFTDSKISTYWKPPPVPHSLKILVLIYISSKRYSFWLLNHPLHLRNPLASYWDRPCNRTFAHHSMSTPFTNKPVRKTSLSSLLQQRAGLTTIWPIILCPKNSSDVFQPLDGSQGVANNFGQNQSAASSNSSIVSPSALPQ